MKKNLAESFYLLWVISVAAAAQTVQCDSDRVCKMYEQELNLALSSARSGKLQLQQQELRELIQLDTKPENYVGAMQTYYLEEIASSQLAALTSTFDKVRIDKQFGIRSNGKWYDKPSLVA